MPPSWLQTIAWISLVSAGICAVIILLDIFVAKHRQKMGVMEWVWPITALYLGVFGLAFYWLVGRRSTPKYEAAHGPRQFPFWVRVGVSASHCGGGCTLGDIIAETLIYVTGITVFGATIWASFIVRLLVRPAARHRLPVRRRAGDVPADLPVAPSGRRRRPTSCR